MSNYEMAALGIPPYKLMTDEELQNLPVPLWRVKGVLPESGLAFVYGASGSGKTFLVLDLAMAIAGGKPWFGNKVMAAPVVYIALEAGAGIRQRVKAWRVGFDLGVPDLFRVGAEFVFSLDEPDNVKNLANVVRAALGSGAVIIIDTLARATPGMDENSGLDMGRAIQGADQLSKLVGGLVVLVHHTGKDSGKGMRGSSALYAAADAVIEVTAGAMGGHSWRAPKVKEAGSVAAHTFSLDSVCLGRDADGDSISSCVVRWNMTADVVGKAQAGGANQQAVLEALKPALDEAPFGLHGAPDDVRALRSDAVLKVATQALKDAGVEPRRCSERAKVAIKTLIDRRALKVGGEGWQGHQAHKAPVWIA